MKYSDFYAQLGKLLYAIADVDGVISEQEKKALYEIVSKDLVPEEKHVDSQGTDTAFYTEMEFDFQDEAIGDTEAAFNSFIDFIDEHQTAIDDKMKNKILFVAEKLADAYYGTNKKEEELIKKLIDKLKKKNFKKLGEIF